MILNGLTVADADGVHGDDWCWPKVRMRIVAKEKGTELRIGVWLKPEPLSPSRVALTFQTDNMPRTTRFVPFGQPVELSFPVAMNPAEELGVEITCENRVTSGDDHRELSFSLMSLVLM